MNTLSIDDLPRLAVPVVEYIAETKPDIVIGCDRGARLFSLAVHAMWRKTMEGAPFPTDDGAIHFARVSNSDGVNRRHLQERVDDILDRYSPDPHLLFIDDICHSGSASMTARQVAGKRAKRISFATMHGNSDGVHAIGTNELLHDPFSDNPAELGVQYTRGISAIESQIPRIQRTDEMRVNRAMLDAAVKHAEIA